MTIERAKKLLENKHKGLSNSEIQSKIDLLSEFADTLVDAVLKKFDTININETSHNPS